jgi:hypothetical protein
VYLILPSDALDRTLRHDYTGRVRTSTNLRLSADAAPVAHATSSVYYRGSGRQNAYVRGAGSIRFQQLELP